VTLQLFPPNFPTELAHAAFSAGNEAAWQPATALAAVEWFTSHGYAVLGTEVWLLQNERIQSLPLGLGGLGEVHGNKVNRGSKETWSSFVTRSGQETLAYLRAFKPSDIVEQGQLFFNITWIGEDEFAALGEMNGP